MSEVAARTARALRAPHNWLQLAKFGLVGLSGYVVNLVVYAALLGIGAHKAAFVSFIVSAANNHSRLGRCTKHRDKRCPLGCCQVARLTPFLGFFRIPF